MRKGCVRVHHWTGLDAPGHPILAGRIDALRASLSGEARHEPSGVLLLGIARDRVLFRGVPHPASLMTQIADVYDALRTNRPHRASLDRETALGILREGRGTQFEPTFLDRFLRMVS